MRFRTYSAGLALLLGAALPAGAQNVSLAFENGSVTLSAQNATVPMILAEWARLGDTQIINGERVPGGPVTLELVDVSERQAIDVLLRSAGGYLLAARRGDAQAGSQFDRILIVPTVSQPSNPQPPPGFSPAPPPLPMFDDFPDVDMPDIQQFRTPRDFIPPDGPMPMGGPMPPQPYQPDPDDMPPPSARPVRPGVPGPLPGAMRPGEILPVPQPQDQPQVDDDP